MKLFLDDIRQPYDCLGYMYKRIGALNPIYNEGEWYIVRNYDQFCKAIDKFEDEITHISFDHDLADEHYLDESKWDIPGEYEKLIDTFKEKTGYECALYFKEKFKNKEIWPVLFCHSMNPVGTERIINLFK